MFSVVIEDFGERRVWPYLGLFLSKTDFPRRNLVKNHFQKESNHVDILIIHKVIRLIRVFVKFLAILFNGNLEVKNFEAVLLKIRFSSVGHSLMKPYNYSKVVHF